jgi:two-component system, OmpR family, sensor histidine kinase KdpD
MPSPGRASEKEAHLSPCLDPAAILEALGHAAIVVDADGVIRLANQMAARWVGRSPAELTGLSYDDWSQLLEQSFAPVQGTSGVNGSGPEGRERLQTMHHPRRVFERELYPIYSLAEPDRPLSGRLEVLRNVTDEARLDEERERLEARHGQEVDTLEKRLEQMEKLKMELTANVTHDLRTPLACIKASVSGLLAGDVAYDPQELRETLTVIEEETDRLQRRVQNLLSMSRMESGDAVLSRDWVDIADVVASALESMRSVSGYRPVQTDFPEDLPLVLADYDQVQIAIRNLIENAFLYSPPDTPVEVSASVGLGHLRVRVRDYGSGLMPDEFERVFDKFYRGRSARRIPGTGLGLPICRGIAEAHGGRLWAEHAPGGGVAFVFSLPLPEEQIELDAASETEKGME